MHTKRIHHRTKKRHTFATLLQVPLMGMERQLQLLAQVLFYRSSGFNKFALVRRNDVKVIDIPAIVPKSQLQCHEPVQLVEVDVAQQL